jgi:hypothetical protein
VIKAANITRAWVGLTFVLLLFAPSLTGCTTGHHSGVAAVIEPSNIRKITIHRGGGFEGFYIASIHSDGCAYINTPNGILRGTHSTSLDFASVKQSIDDIKATESASPSTVRQMLDATGYTIIVYGASDRPIDQLSVGAGSPSDEFVALERIEGMFFLAHWIPVNWHGGYPGCPWHSGEFGKAVGF